MNDDVRYAGSDLEALATLKRYQAWIVDSFAPYLGGPAIEFGAGLGNISALLRPHVDSLDLVEPSPNLTGPLSARFAGDAAVTVFADTLEARLGQTADGAYRSVVLVNVLEHIEDDRAALDGFFRILEPGGHLLLFVPALRFLFSELDRVHGHFRRYHLKELEGRVRGAGFAIVAGRYFDAFGVLPWWLLNTVMGATGFNARLAETYDRVFVPVSRAVEAAAAPPLGKNVLIVARKPEAE